MRAYPYIYAIWVCLSLLCDGGHSSMFAIASAQIFGIKNGGQIFTIIFCVVPVTTMLGFILVLAKVSDKTIFIIATILTFLYIILLWFFND